ncbi:hypothetical protein ABZ990_24510 [Streptomyces sp. NPDC046203]|uniref:hypothetical protein n=1 Tax=Streptomyces sp. NPDC046203 TaxID=3154602 RepID=UPI00340B10C2
MRSIHDVLGGAGYPDPFTDEDLAGLRQEIVRDVTSTLMFGSSPAPVGHFPTLHDEAARQLTTLSGHLLRHRDAAEHVAQLAHEGLDDDGALRFGCLLFLVDEREGARFWWGFAAGAGNATAAQCLFLYHQARGELRDADQWALQAVTGDDPVGPRTSVFRAPARPENGPGSGSDARPDASPARHEALRAAVRSLKVDAVEESGYSRVLHPEQHLADRIGELAHAL